MDAQLEERLRDLPALPGVYLMKDARGSVIYVGKARALNKRVRSYFDGRHREGHRAAVLMIPHVRDIEWVITESEQEALILEANLIRKYRPRYNVRQKDDKHFPYLKVTIREPFPRVEVVRQVKDDGDLYFGPYLNSGAMRTLLDLIPRLFRIRECDLKLPLKTPARPCLAWHIGRCDAPCAERIDRERYGEQVREALRLLEGKRDDLLREWKMRMQEASARLDFEEAARWRDRVKALEATATRQGTDAVDASVHLDVVAVRRSGSLACVVILEYRDGVLSERRSFRLECALEQDEGEILTEFLPSWYAQSGGAPPEILLESPPEDAEVLAEALSLQSARKVRIRASRLGDKNTYLRLAVANAEMLLIELKAESVKYDEVDRAVFDLQKELGLPNPPLRIECFDVSHLHGTDTVASMVCFRHGRPQKSAYRKFRVKSVEGIDDFASMREIVGRRLRRLLDEGGALPDLLVIDGGRGQVEAAWAVVRSLGVADLPVIGLAKRLEEIVLPGNPETLLLKRSHPALKLLQRIRDEAHRFALTYQRSLRRAHWEVSWLAGIRGIGPATRKKVLSRWRTADAFLRASEDEKMELLGKAIYARIARALHERTQTKTGKEG